MSSNKVSLNKIIIGTSAWGSKISYSNCYLILEKLLINGFDQFDTAPNYGSGYSQNIINSVLVKKKLQHCDEKVFEDLSHGDLLFIDSTHTLKIGSDVSKIYLDIIPKLKPGVIVHIHDIYFPYNFSRDANNTMFQWLETQMLQALLVNNSKLEILFCMSQLHYEHPNELKKIFPIYEPQKDYDGISLNKDSGFFPSSIYLITK